MHARRGDRDRGDIVHALGGFQDGVDQDRFFHAVFGFKLGEQLIEIMNVPGALDLGQHDDIELLPDGGDDLGYVVEHPGRVERVDARPQSGLAELANFRHGDEARARRLLGVGWNGVFQIAEHNIDLRHQLRHLGAHFFDMRRHEMNHALEPQRQVAQRRGCADRQRLEEIARQFHARAPQRQMSKARMNGRAPPSRF
jgi:hypothetical protein